jgi:hypothetical protein
MPREHGLLIEGFDTDKSHVGLPHGRENGLRVIAIVLRPLALAEGLHELGCHQPHGVAVSRQLPSPVMRRATGLHAERARRYRRRPLRKAVEAELSVEQHVSGAIGSTYHDDGLGEVCTNGGNLVRELPLG